MGKTGFKIISTLCALLVTGLTFFPYQGFATENNNEIIEKTRLATVMVLSFNASTGKHGQATGFFVGNQAEIITNDHVVAGANHILIKTSDNNVYQVAGIVSRDAKSDLVKLAVKMADTPPYSLPISTTLPNTGDPVIIIGNPDGQKGIVSTGTITSLYHVPNFGNLLQTNAAIAPGSSGSPVVNPQGEVIGVVSFQFGSTGRDNFAIPASKISAMKSTGTIDLIHNNKTKLKSSDLMQQGHKALQIKDYQTALSIFLWLLNTDNDNNAQWRNWQLWFYIGRCQGGLGKHSKAVHAFKEAIKLMPDNADSHYSLGVAYSFLEIFSKAKKSYQEAIRLNPNFIKAHFNLALTCHAQQDYTCFMVEYAKVKEMNGSLASKLIPATIQ